MSLFGTLVGQLDKKSAGRQLDEAVADLVQKIRLTGKPGKLTLTLNVKPTDADAQTVHVTQKISVTAPEIGSKPTLFFTTDDGGLTRTDPSQTEMQLDVVDGGRSDLPPEQPAALAANAGN